MGRGQVFSLVKELGWAQALIFQITVLAVLFGATHDWSVAPN